MPVAATKALVKAAESGEPLPLPGALSEIVRRGGVFRKGHLVMIAAISNAGKSTFAEWLTAETNAPTLYFSADQDVWTTTTKLAATLSGQPTNAVAEALSGGEGQDYYNSVLESSNIQFSFDSNPSLEDIGAELSAYVDTWDEYPDCIVIDNLGNLDTAGEHQDDRWICSELHGLARRTKACVIVLIHMKETGVKDPSMPLPKKEIYNQLHRDPDLILSVALHEESSEFRVAIVKTREAKADPMAKRPIVLGSDFERCQFFAAPRRQSAWGGWNGDDE